MYYVYIQLYLLYIYLFFGFYFHVKFTSNSQLQPFNLTFKMALY